MGNRVGKRNDNMARRAEKCPYCGRPVPAQQTDSIPILNAEFRGYSIILMKLQTKNCPCGARGYTPVFVGETFWSEKTDAKR